MAPPDDQLTHLGRRTNWNKADWLPVLAPSPVREPAHRAFPKEMEDWDIERIVADYASAAQRMQAAGLDGIEFECYGHLMDQFWSPATNARTDEYGGSLDNRLRFSLKVLAAVRRAVGPDFIVGCRLVADEDWEKGLTREEGLEICRRLIATGSSIFSTSFGVTSSMTRPSRALCRSPAWLRRPISTSPATSGGNAISRFPRRADQ